MNDELEFIQIQKKCNALTVLLMNALTVPIIVHLNYTKSINLPQLNTWRLWIEYI